MKKPEKKICTKNRLPSRQIHMDFHTAEWIPAVGERFDSDNFAGTLARAGVNSVTLFARCHHGYLYYDSKRFPERVHPTLVHRNMLVEQIEACRKRGIRTPIYLTVQLDELTAREHPEWLAMDRTGRIIENKPYEAGFGHLLAVNSPYFDFLKEIVNDLFTSVPVVDGLFFDIVIPLDDSSKWTRSQMMERGLDPSDDYERCRFGRTVIEEFTSAMTAHVRSFSRDCSLFYNSGHISCHHRRMLDCYSHFEIESQGSGPWGYIHFPVTARYVRTLGKEFLGMTGKFHSMWGDFHSFKPQASLEYECFRMLAVGAKCSIGDQLHPSGEICPVTYDLIGRIYNSIAEKEPWCYPSSPVAEIGVLHPEDGIYDDETPKAGVSTVFNFPPEMSGIVRMLQEGAHQFDLIDREADFSKYKLLILPDSIPATGSFAARLDAYVADGGKLIASFESGLDSGKNDFLVKSLGIRKTGDGPVFEDGDKKPARGRWFFNNNYTDYVIPSGEIGKNLPETEHVMYLRGLDIEASSGAKVLLTAIESYFDRDWRHYCSHLQTPSTGKSGRPAAVRNGNAIYFCHPLARIYAFNSPLWCRQLLWNAIELLIGPPVVSHTGPHNLLVTYNEQPQENRNVLHLLYYIPERRGEKLEIVEETVPIGGFTVTVREDRPVVSVRGVPQKTAMAFNQHNGAVQIPIERMQGHQMIELVF